MKPETRQHFKNSINTIAAAIRARRAEAREQFAAARACRASGDEAGAARAVAAAEKSRALAADLGFEARQLLLVYAFARGYPYGVLERNRRRAPAPRAEILVAVLGEMAPGIGAKEEAIERWLGPPTAHRSKAPGRPRKQRSGGPPAPAAAEAPAAPAV